MEPLLGVVGIEPCCFSPKNLTYALLVSSVGYVLYTLFNIVGGQIAESSISDNKNVKIKTH